MLDVEFFARINHSDIQRVADEFVPTLSCPADSTNLKIYKTDIAARWLDMFAQAPNPMACCRHPRELYRICRDFGYFTLERIVV